ncbi:MAG: bifunctional (p)ppGpp synthetase/guanosine-3',5'-bis(diphosphate) 3'-pyrophosphohydrolase [Gemmatimonadetes bacterium]|nr:bifunctional (p)ppGpp synthetase/guanosine-3',5'-bis(diphosphate) 3'-pyrophosphohydrolase [Gemmatimonadota bacterium]
MTRKQFLKQLEPHAERLDMALVDRAFEFSERAHLGQKRLSGEPYVSHCAEVARILADLHLDSTTVVAGLVHDVLEDTGTTQRDLLQAFGPEVAEIVDGVTKIGHIPFRSVEERQAENYRKLLLSIAKDLRILLIKFADRLHNMRTLDYLPDEKRRRIALETREIYAPLAHRFGMAMVRWELEDLAFKFLESDAYGELAKKIARKRKERERLIHSVSEPLGEALAEAGIRAEIGGRPKHLYSIYRKMIVRDKPLEEIYDLLAIRVLTESVRDCYHALGITHTLWTPLHERFKDYIATPKSNMYQSLHTTVFGPEGHLFEIQIRTGEMHRTAEIGVAAHWRYKGSSNEKGGSNGSEIDEKLSWFRQMLDWQKDMTDPREFLEYLKIDLFKDEIFVFTPKGDLIQLPSSATPIDFAFMVHTQVGLHCSGAKVNGRIVPLHKELRSGDTVQILTSPTQRPSRDWVNFVRTSKARQIIRRWVREEEFKNSLALGKELIEKELRRNRVGKPDPEELLAVAQKLKQPSVDALHAAVGAGDVSLSQVWNELFPTEEEARRRPSSAFERLVDKVKGAPSGLKIQGIDNMMVRYSQCCQPLPGDPVMGYVTRGRGVSIHRTDCPNLLSIADLPERRVDIIWESDKDRSFLVRLVVAGTDRRGLFADVAGAVSRTSTNIKSGELTALDHGFEGTFVVEVSDLGHLNRVIAAMRRVEGVVAVERKEYLSSNERGIETVA